MMSRTFTPCGRDDRSPPLHVTTANTFVIGVEFELDLCPCFQRLPFHCNVTDPYKDCKVVAPSEELWIFGSGFGIHLFKLALNGCRDSRWIISFHPDKMSTSPNYLTIEILVASHDTPLLCNRLLMQVNHFLLVGHFLLWGPLLFHERLFLSFSSDNFLPNARQVLVDSLG